MWIYEKKLQYPVKIKNPNPKLAQIIISQLGGADGELAASMRYLHQRYSMPYKEVVGILTDVGTEELAHLEIIGSILYQLTRNLSAEEIEKSPLAPYFTDHTTGVYPVAASGVPFDMKYIGVKGDIIADLNEDLAAEQKARAVYENLIDLTNDPDVIGPLLWLRQREIVHFTRFKELFEHYEKMIKNGQMKKINMMDQINQNTNTNNIIFNNIMSINISIC